MAAAPEEAELEKEGFTGWVKKFYVLLPLLFIAVNTQVQAREIVDKIATETYSGFDGAHAPSKVILESKADMPTYKDRDLIDEYGNTLQQWQGNRIANYLYDEYGVVAYDKQSEAACTQDFVDTYNSNAISMYTYRECRLGTPKVTAHICANYEHPAYIAIALLWCVYIILYIAVIAGYTFFSYSSNDIRWYIAAVKMKHSWRNRVMLMFGVLLTLLTAATSFYFLGGGGVDGAENWGDGIQFDDVVEALSKITIFLVINAKAFLDLNKSENYDFDHISMSKDFPDPIYINPCPEEDRTIFNLYGATQTVDEVLFLFEEAYLHRLLFDDHSKSAKLARKGSREKDTGAQEEAKVVQQIVNLFHADDLEDTKSRVAMELEMMAKDPVTRSFVKDSDKLEEMEKFELVRTQTTSHVTKGLEYFRKFMIMAAPVGLIFTSALNILMKVGQNAENIQYGGFEIGDRPIVSAPMINYPISGITYYEPIYPGDLTTNMAEATYGDMVNDCWNWYGILNGRQHSGTASNMCDQSYPAKVLTTNLVCPFTSSALFVTMLAIWCCYTCTLGGLLVFSLKDYSTNDLRFYLVSDSIKSTMLWKVVMGVGYALTAITFIIALVYESMRPWVQWTDITNVFIFLFLMLRVLGTEVDKAPFVKFSDEIMAKPLEEVYPYAIPVVIQPYSSYKKSLLPKTRPTTSVFSQLISLYLKSLVLEDPLLVSSTIDFEQATQVLRGLKSELVVEKGESKGKGKDLEMTPPVPPVKGDEEAGVAVPPGPGEDQRVIVPAEDPGEA